MVERLIRGCAQQGLELKGWPFDMIAQVVAPDDAQRAALEGLRDSTRQAAEALASSCPQAVPAAPAARLEAVEQAIDAASVAFAAVQPALEGFYGTLDDEQKARIVRGMDLQKAQASRSRSVRPDQDLRRDLTREELAREDFHARELAREGLSRDAREGMSGASCGAPMPRSIAGAATPIATASAAAARAIASAAVPPPPPGARSASISPWRCAAGRSARSSAACA